MMIAGSDLYRLAGWATWLALIALVISAVALALFFGGVGEVFGPINDAFITIALLALIPAVVAVDRIAAGQLSPWVRIVSVAAIVGILIASIGNILLIIGRISLETSYVTGGVGIVPVLAWIVLVAVLSLGVGVLPSTVGWLSVAALAIIVISSIVVAITSGVGPRLASVALVIGMAVWLGGLAVELGSRVGSPA